MGLPRNYKRTLPQKSLSQSSVERPSNNAISFSQPVPSTSTTVPASTFYEKSPNASLDRSKNLEEERQLTNKTIRYLLALDRDKQAITKARIIKNVMYNQGKYFHRIMNNAKNHLSEIFGYRLIELEGNKYILVNDIENKLPHIYPSTMEASQRVLLFIVLVHIFMHEQSCTEESLCNFLTNMGVSCIENHCHPYFGNVKHLISEVFVNQKYLDKITQERDDLTKIEYKWGIRAEHEFSRRTALNFVAQVYNGRPINSWPLQYNALIAHERTT